MIDTLSIRSAYRGKTLPETTIQILCDEIDRLRGEQQTPPQGKTVQIPVLTERGGRLLGSKYFIILPVPKKFCVEARVEGE